MRAGTSRTPDDALLALVREHAAELLRFARRHSLCDDDAHDAYQRGLEVLVRRMRTDPPGHPLSWLRTVIRHECVTVRGQREQLVGRAEADLDRHEARHLEDPGERAVAFERLRQTAEALQRLKQAELIALLQRAEGFSYKEIGARNGWTYTKVNRAVTEGRRALLQRLGAIESGAECARWLPLLSRLADGEASTADRAQLRPHLRACAGCRATLRELHDAPRAVAALLPPALALGGLAARPGATVARHAEGLVHALLSRTTLGVARIQSALDALPGAKLAAVAASGAALAGGGFALSQTALAPARPGPARVTTALARAAAPAAPFAAAARAGDLPRAAGAASGAEFADATLAAEFAARRRGSGGPPAAEFAFAAGTAGALGAPAGVTAGRGSVSEQSAGAAASARRSTAAPRDAASSAAPARAASRAPSSTSFEPRASRSAPPAEFAGP
jgi:RNA polymerase sigma factor (sigma-70 family)